MTIRLTVALFFFLVFAPNLSGTHAATTWPSAEWPHSAPEAQGMTSVELAAMLERIESDNPGIRSVTVVRHGTVVLDTRISPFARGDRHDIHSCTKSVLSALVGIAIDKESKYHFPQLFGKQNYQHVAHSKDLAKALIGLYHSWQV